MIKFELQLMRNPYQLPTKRSLVMFPGRYLTVIFLIRVLLLLAFRCNKLYTERSKE